MSIDQILYAIALIGALSSTIFIALVFLAAFRYRRSRSSVDAPPALPPPPLSLLKPVHGAEPLLQENLESFFHLDYPRYELLFCARFQEDAALAVARELAARHPAIPARFLTTGEPHYVNAKVHSLEVMAAAAQHEILVISDSDVHVEPDYLREVVAPFLSPGDKSPVGVVTCLYRGVPAAGLWASLEALGMSVEMTSGVLVANLLEGMKFALGPTMATRQECVRKIGGWSVLADYCADDYVLGNLVSHAGYEVVLSRHVIDHIVLNRTFVQSLLHQVRWMRSTRFSRPWGHLGTGLTFAMPFGLLGLLLAISGRHPLLGFAIFAWAAISRILQSVIVGWGITRDPRAWRRAWLYPLRDLLGFLLWCASYTSSIITWRGERYRLVAGGKMVKP